MSDRRLSCYPMRPGHGFLLLTMTFCLVSGCLAPEVPSSTVAPALDQSRPAIVAVLEAGVNPYHEAFRAVEGKGAERWADALGATVVNLTQEGSLEGRLSVDEQMWQSMEPGRLYAFAGTRLLAVSITKRQEEPLMLDPTGHGTGVASMITVEDPDALVLVVQTNTRFCNYGQVAEDCPVVIPASRSMAWAAEQPWIDIISVSIGFPGSPPMFFGDDEGPYVAASRLASENGKLLVSAAGNTLAPGVVHPFQGPPWLITVGGAEPAQNGESPLASKGADVMANYSALIADSDSLDGWSENAGTSFAAPRVAATMARAFALVREARPGEAVDPQAMRAALNASALPWGPREWNPTAPISNDTLTNLVSQSVPVLSPTQQGWGYVDGSLAPEIARRVLEGDLEPPAEKATTAAYMAQWQAGREAYWGRPAP